MDFVQVVQVKVEFLLLINSRVKIYEYICNNIHRGVKVLSNTQYEIQETFLKRENKHFQKKEKTLTFLTK
jgi:hypothetical protein